MKEAYRKMMRQVSLSDHARGDILEKIEREKFTKRKGRPLRAALIAACVCVVLTGVALAAVEALTGVGLIEIIRTERQVGYHSEFNDVELYPITALSEEVRGMIGDVEYRSWEEAEKTLGIALGTSITLSDPSARPVAYLNGRNLGMDARVHCYVRYSSYEDQLYSARATAYYAINREWDGESESSMDAGPTDIIVILSAEVEVEHPGISDDRQYHSRGKLYDTRDVDDLTEEQYTTPGGLTATILTANWKDRSPIYEAIFAWDNISYSITIKGSPYRGAVIPKDLLYEILDGFQG